MHSLWRNDRVYGDTYVNYFELIISLYVCELTLYLSQKSKKQCIHEKRHHMVLHKYAKIRPSKKKKDNSLHKVCALGTHYDPEAGIIQTSPVGSESGSEAEQVPQPVMPVVLFSV